MLTRVQYPLGSSVRDVRASLLFCNSFVAAQAGTAGQPEVSDRLPEPSIHHTHVRCPLFFAGNGECLNYRASYTLLIRGISVKYRAFITVPLAHWSERVLTVYSLLVLRFETYGRHFFLWLFASACTRIRNHQFTLGLSTELFAAVSKRKRTATGFRAFLPTFEPGQTDAISMPRTVFVRVAKFQFLKSNDCSLLVDDRFADAGNCDSRDSSPVYEDDQEQRRETIFSAFIHRRNQKTNASISSSDDFISRYVRQEMNPANHYEVLIKHNRLK